MERRNLLGAALAALAAPATAQVVCMPVMRRGGLVVSTKMDCSAYLGIKLDGVEQKACIMAQEGDDGFVVRYAQDAKGHFIYEPGLDVKLETARGKVELFVMDGAPEWAVKMLHDARELWA